MPPCPPDDVLGALVQQVLPDDESERVRSHIDECNACAQAMIAALRGGALATDAVPTMAIGTPSLPHVTRREPVAIGTTIGRYVVRALLGAGGMGHVYEAYDAELDRSIALKVLRPELAIAETLTDRLVRESRLMAKVSHPSVITVHDVGREGDTVFIAMELIRGATLGSYVSRTRGMSWRPVVELFERAGAGLAAAHRAGIVHRDFKPDNVLVELDRDAAARIVVTDFGIARASTIAEELEHGVTERPSDPRITATGSAIGTPAYMAPEQLGGAPVDLRADVFAFSASLWESLFGQRPFRGDTVDEIRAAMQRPPRPPRGGAPRRLVRVLERGLAIDPRDRWQDMTELVQQLASLRGRRRRVTAVAGITGLVAAGVATAAFIATPAREDPCARATLAYDAFGLRAAIADPTARELVATKVTSAADTWRQTHQATCRADRHPIQAPKTIACLDARKLEITTFVEDVIADHGRHARELSALIGDPAQCIDPAPSLLTAKVPSDPALRREVTALRYRAFTAEATRNRSDFKTALAEAARLVVDTETVWPFAHAEALYLLGSTQSLGGDSKLGIATLRRAAAVAEAAHHHYIAANSWIQLVLGSTFDEGAPERGLEYMTYAEAALDRIGRPPLSTSMFEYAKGVTLVELSRFDEGETALRRAVELAEEHALSTLPQAIQGLAYLYESQGRYAEAADAYRRSLAQLPEEPDGSTSNALIVRERLAVNLAMLGNPQEAERFAREAIELAETTLPPENLDRALVRSTLAEVYMQDGRYELALDAIRHAQREVAKIAGERSSRYGETTQIEADILSNLGRHAEAAQRFARACDIIAFHNGEGGASVADCWLAEAIALGRAGKVREAMQLVDKAHPILLAAYGDQHPQIANAYLVRGELRQDAGRADDALADLEAALAQFEKLSLDPGHLAATQWALAKSLWKRDPGRARGLLDSALGNFGKASPTWTSTRTEAAEWLATNGKPRRR